MIFCCLCPPLVFSNYYMLYFVSQIWKDKVLPVIKKPLAEQASHINLHLVLYQETTIINLLEVFSCSSVQHMYLIFVNYQFCETHVSHLLRVQVILYHREVCESMNAASLLEVIMLSQWLYSLPCKCWIPNFNFWGGDNLDPLRVLWCFWAQNTEHDVHVVDLLMVPACRLLLP